MPEDSLQQQPAALSWSTRLAAPVAEALGGASQVGRIVALNTGGMVADATLALLVRDQRDRPRAVALCSSAVSPDMTARNMARALQARNLLGPNLGSVILEPLGQGHVDGLSYAIVPYCQPLSVSRVHRRVQWWRLRRPVLNWLEAATRCTVSEVGPGERGESFVDPLTHLIELAAMPDDIRTAAERALDRLDRQQWQPRHVLMHGDLHEGNILIGPRAGDRSRKSWCHRFVIIDWAGASMRGHAIYDLLRLARSLRLSPRQLHREIGRHCELLGCRRCDAQSHLLAGLGHLGMHLEHFPFDRYLELVRACVDALWAAQPDRE